MTSERSAGSTARGGSTSRFSEVRRAETPERRAKIDAVKRAMADAERLAEIRTSRGMTQVELAERLGKSQGGVSELERRDAVYLSSLRDYVEALGGRLEVAAVFDEERHRIRMGGTDG